MMAEDCERQAEREAVERLDHFLLQLAAHVTGRSETNLFRSGSYD